MPANAVKVKLLGGGREVGRAAVLVQYRDRGLLLDYGVLLNDEPKYPMHVKPRDLDGIFLTHAHLDHSGAIPLFYTSSAPPKLYSTQLTYELSKILILDFLSITKGPLLFEAQDVNVIEDHVNPIPLNGEMRVGDFEIRIYNAGHIPGSTMFEVNVAGRRLLYSGDINTIDTRLVKAVDRPRPGFDLLISESTYAGTEHPPREHMERELIESTIEVIESGGRVIIPAFAVGRAQEILCVFEHYKFPYDIYLDGMARIVSEKLLKYSSFLRDPELLFSAMKKVRIVKSHNHRRKIIKRPCVIVAPAGMLKGGPASYYMKVISRDPKSAVFLVSFQIPGTPGRRLLEEGVWVHDNIEERVEALVKWFDFSSHAGHSGLKSFITSCKPEKVLLTHGEPGKDELLANDIRDHVKDVIIGKNGMVIEL